MIVYYTKTYGIWKHVEQMITRALDKGSNFTLWEIHTGIQEGKFQLWVDQTDKVNAVLVTAIQNDDKRFCLLAVLCGKKINEWITGLSFVERWAKENDCEEMRIYGRKGWFRYLGYEPTGRDELDLYISRKAL